ncbi:cationic peroxidase 1-like [Prunus avium]|uniref:Peroxidase n=1 Tax=Prunus avium TaxID=42229 RepID=A0A6P5TKX1_PRUAV|nr:cationic peroxidase 1-like [Prunus avium]
MGSYHAGSCTATNIKISFSLFLFLVGVASAQLSPTFYSTSCPNALSTIKSAVDSAVSSEARMGASLLRLHFHDCFVNGCDASVLLDDTASLPGEKTAAPNANSLRGFDVIDTIKTQLESLCPKVVSCADILTVAARDSIVALGGPTYTVPLGRRDATTASLSAANSNLPGPQLNLAALISAFSNKGFTAKEMVALSGSHTIGQARCTTFRNRLYNEANINASFATSLKSQCPSSGGDNTLSPLDVTSPTSFDNAYFRNLVSQKGLLHSDQQLYSGGSTNTIVDAYISNTGTFRADFANAMKKMGNLSPLTGTNGQIRTNCRKVN